MANELCAYGFGKGWDGNYFPVITNFETRDVWMNENGNYWLYRDAWYWYISISPSFYGDGYRLARKEFSVIDPSPAGSYNGLDGKPNGNVKSGLC